MIYKHTPKYLWLDFVLDIDCWTWGLPLNVVYIPRDNPLETTNFSLASRCQFVKVSWIRMGAHVHFSFLALEPHLSWICAGPVMPPQFLWINMCISPVVLGRFCFLSVIHTLGLQSYNFLFYIALWVLLNF